MSKECEQTDRYKFYTQSSNQATLDTNRRLFLYVAVTARCFTIVVASCTTKNLMLNYKYKIILSSSLNVSLFPELVFKAIVPSTVKNWEVSCSWELSRNWNCSVPGATSVAVLIMTKETTNKARIVGAIFICASTCSYTFAVNHICQVSWITKYWCKLFYG